MTRKQESTVPGPEKPQSPQGHATPAVAATPGGARPIGLWAPQVHRPQPEYHLPAHPADWTVQSHSGGYDRTLVWHPPGDPERAVRVQAAAGDVMQGERTLRTLG